MTDFRALSIELLDCLEKADWPPRYRVVFQQWVDIASAALAEPCPATKAMLDAFHEQQSPSKALAAALTVLAVRIKGADGIRQDIFDIINELNNDAIRS
jgi:hypothetical protein